MMAKFGRTCTAILVLISWAAITAPCIGSQTDEEAAIRKSDEAYVDAYNKHDAKRLAALWSPGAVYTDPATGESAVGREAIEKMFTQTLADLGDAKLEVKAESISFVSPNVAIETGTARVAKPGAEAEETKYSAVFMKLGDQWLLDRVTEEETPAPPPSNFEHLKELDWMVGSWVDQDSNATVQTDCEWTKNKNFMTRSFAAVVGDSVNMAGMQIVGWDPVAKRIRSWVFDSDGGYSEGKWSHKDNRWVIQQSGVLADGRKTSAVNIIKRVDDDSFTWQSVQRQVGGDVLPDVDEVLIVRKAPK
jgi:uncharacterized protein (TIGR02246 family)